jgi:prepilin-type processing-associated H-X9-DG protein
MPNQAGWFRRVAMFIQRGSDSEMNQSARRKFSLFILSSSSPGKTRMHRAVNFLVLVLAIVLAGGLLVTGIGKVRDAANRTQCSNNLRQIGLGQHNYQATYNYFPRAAEPNSDLAAERRLSWLLITLPFLEADNLYPRIDKKKAWDAEENRFVALIVIRTYHCPGYPNQPPQSTLVPSHYVGIGGLGADAAVLPLQDSRAGFFGFEREINLTDIEGHTSTLLMAMETLHVSGAWTAAGRPTVRGLEQAGVPTNRADREFGGIHSGGMNALFADASVRFIRDSADPRLLEAMATLQDSKVAIPVGDD